MIRCVLLDRDGTLGVLQDKRYPQTFSPFTDIQSVVAALHARGVLVGVITNQASIARGTGAEYDFDAEFREYGLDAWAICPHDDKDRCSCRKPESGLLLDVANRLQVPLEACLVVGDRLSDIQCAKRVGAQAALVLTGYGEAEKNDVLRAYPDTMILPRFDDVLRIL